MSTNRKHGFIRHRNRTLAILAAFGLVAAACGDDDDGAAATTEPAATTPSTEADEAGDHDDEGDEGDDHDDEGDDHDHGGDHDHDDEGDEGDDHDHGDDHGHGGEVGAAEHDEAQPRLLLGDTESGEIEVLDLISGETVGSLGTDGFGAMYAFGRHVLAVDSDNDIVTLIDGGAWAVPHGDHNHYYTADAEVLDTVTGNYPVHVVGDDDEVAVFYDDDGVAELYALDDLAAGELVAVGEVATSDPHHGVVVPFGGDYIVSVPAPDPSELPTGVEVRHGTDEVGDSFGQDCPSLHGEAASDGGVVFACDNGLLWVHGHGDHWHADLLAYPDHAGDDDVRIGSFAHTHGIAVVAGQFDDHSVIITELAGDAPELVLAELDAEIRDLAIAEDAASVVALTTDGSMHLIDAVTGEVDVSAEVLDQDPLPDDAHWSDPRRSVVVVGERAYVTDPDAGTVTEVAINDGFRETRTFTAGVAPALAAVVGHSH